MINNVCWYTGVGARDAPESALEDARKVGTRLSGGGSFGRFVLRSGGAAGMDEAFEEGARRGGGKRQIWIPDNGFRGLTATRARDGEIMPPLFEPQPSEDPGLSIRLPTRAAYRFARIYHPAWSKLDPYVQSLMARNVHQVLGAHLSVGEEDADGKVELDPYYLATASSFVLCWTEDGAEEIHEVTAKTGGTGMAIRIACHFHIEVINMRRPEWRAKLREAIITCALRMK